MRRVAAGFFCPVGSVSLAHGFWRFPVGRRCCASSAPGGRAGASSLGQGTQRGFDAVDDDFVVNDVPGVSVAASSCPSQAPSSSLGVVRDAPTPVGQEASRLGIPLETPREGKPLPREDSRAITLVDINTIIEREQEAFKASRQRSDDNSSAQPLPYDDEEFAETILSMEVEGALDEAWQDGRRAHAEDVRELVNLLREMRVRDVVAIDVSQKTSSFDYMVMGTCEGPRHIHLAAWSVQEADKAQRITKIPRQQTDHLWEVVPVGRIVVNLMQESYRSEVNLERKWAVTKSMDPLHAAEAPVSEGRQSRAHGLWTLTLNLQDLEDFEVDYCKDILLSQR